MAAVEFKEPPPEIKKTESGIIIFPEVFSLMTPEQKAIADATLNAFEPWHSFYLAHKQSGFYLSGEKKITDEEFTAAAKKDPLLLHPYTNVQRGKDGELHPLWYFDTEPFKTYTLETADRLEDLVNTALQFGGSNGKLYEVVLGPEIMALREGRFDLMLRHHNNQRVLPDPEVAVLLQDVYLDAFQNIKQTAQAWSGLIDGESTAQAQRLIEEGLGNTAHLRTRKLKVAPQAIVLMDWVQAGLASEGPWKGNSVQVSDTEREELGSRPYIFRKGQQYRIHQQIEGGMKERVPQITEYNEAKVREADWIRLIYHESVGHPGINISEQADEELGNEYATVKESIADVNSMVAVWRSKELHQTTKKVVSLGLMDKWLWAVNRYLQEEDPQRKKYREAYAKEAVAGLNYYIQKGAVDLTPKDAVYVRDYYRFFQVTEEFSYSLKDVLHNLKYDKRAFSRFQSQYTRPQPFLTGPYARRHSTTKISPTGAK